MEINYVFILVVLLISNVQAIMWSHAPNAQKCMKEDLKTNVLVTGDYEVEEAPGQKIDYVVSIDFFYLLTFLFGIPKSAGFLVNPFLICFV